MAKETFYFPHDFEPLSDPKLLAFVGEFGGIGYGVYWRIVEMLHSDEGHKLEHERYITAAIAKQMSTPVEQIEAMIEFAIDVCKLFVSDGQSFWSERVFRNFDKREEIKEKKSRAGKASAEARKKAAELAKIESPVEQPSTAVEQSEAESNKVKESKGKESKVKEYKKLLLSEIELSDFPEINSEYFEAAKAFHLLFKRNLQEAGAATTTVDKAKGTAIDDIRLMIETDKYSLEDLRAVYRFLQKDSFWKQNILSTSKLREKMPNLKLKIHNGSNRNTDKEGTSWNELAEIVHSAFNQ